MNNRYWNGRCLNKVMCETEGETYERDAAEECSRLQTHITELESRLAETVALPVITAQIAMDFRGVITLIEQDDTVKSGWCWRWTQDAVDFACLIAAAPAPAEAESGLARLKEFARSCAEDYDCDLNTHGYNTQCRACTAKALLKEQGDE